MYRKMIGMPDVPRDPDPDDAPMPRWVKLLAIAGVVFLLAFALLHLTGRGLGHRVHGGQDSAHHGGQDAPHHGSGQP